MLNNYIDPFGGRLTIAYTPPTRRQLRRYVMNQIRAAFRKQPVPETNRVGYGFTPKQIRRIRHITKQWTDSLEQRLQPNIDYALVEGLQDLHKVVAASIVKELGLTRSWESATTQKGVTTKKTLRRGILQTKVSLPVGRGRDDVGRFKESVLNAMVELLKEGKPLNQPAVCARLGLGDTKNDRNNALSKKLHALDLKWQELKTEAQEKYRKPLK